MFIRISIVLAFVATSGLAADVRSEDLQAVCQRLVDEAVASGEQGGVQFCAYKDGKCIVDVWAGTLSTNAGAAKVDGRSLFPVFSTEKPLLATAVHRAVEKGLMDYDKPLCTWWPEFTGDGKEKLTLGLTLGYRSGMPAKLDPAVFPTVEDQCDWSRICKWAAAVKPELEPGTKQRYMSQSYGWYLGHPLEVACGKPLKDCLDELVLEPAGIMDDFFFVTNEGCESRIATFYGNASVERMNDRRRWRFCLPSVYAVANARSVARFYNRLCGFDGKDPLVRNETLDNALKPCRHPSDPLPDAQMMKDKWFMIFGMGYGLWGEAERMDRVFGHGGAGGSEGLVDRDNRLIVAYTCNFDNHKGGLRQRLYDAVGMKWRYWKDKDADIQTLQMKSSGRAAPFAMPELKDPPCPDRTFSVADYGAKPGGFNCTEAFARAVSACEAAGGGHVAVPSGRWIVGPIRLASNCDLHLSKDAVLEFTDEPADYLPPVKTTWEGVECMGYSPLIYAYAATNVSITGSGTLAPRMDMWRKWFDRGPGARVAMEMLYGWCSTNAPIAARDVTAIPDNRMRPQLIQMNRSANVLLDGFRIRESPFWTIHLYMCENCIVRGIDSAAHGVNNDGIDIDMTRNVLVENCRFDQGDDGIVLKAGRNADGWRLNRPTENVVVTNCTFSFAHSLLGIGSELSGGIRNVWMSDCRIGHTYNMIYIKTNRRRGGFVENVWVDHVTCDGDVRSAVIAIDMGILYQWAVLPDYELRYTSIRNINLSNVTAKSADWAVDLKGDAHQPPEDIRIGDLHVGAFRSGEKRVENCRNVVVETR